MGATVEALKAVPEIITAASATNLGILALLVLVVAWLGFVYFRNSSIRYRFAVFVLMFFGVAAFGVVAISVQHEDARRKTQEEVASAKAEAADTIKGLKLKLYFLGKAAVANPYNVQVTPYVQKKRETQWTLRKDLVQVIRGVGGIEVDFEQLSVGDTLYLEADDGGTKWRSDDMRMPEAHLEMNPQRIP